MTDCNYDHLSFDQAFDPSPQQQAIVLLFEGPDDEEIAVRYIQSELTNSVQAVGEANLRVIKENPNVGCWYVGCRTLPSPYHYQETIGLVGQEAPELIQVNYYGPCAFEELLVRADARPEVRAALDSLDDYPCLDDMAVSQVQHERLVDAFDNGISHELELHLPDGETEDSWDLFDLLWFEISEEDKWDLFLAAMEESGVRVEEYGDGLSIDIDLVAPYWLRLLLEMLIGWLSSHRAVMSDPVKVAHVCWAIIQLRRVI